MDAYIICPNCQAQNQDYRTRCRICGTKLPTEEEREKERIRLAEEKQIMQDAKQRDRDAKMAQERAHAEELSKILISSGFSFDGYRIVKYSGYISGDDATQMDRGGIFGKDNGKRLTDALVKIRIQALKELKEAALALGCNAVIGVDFDYLTLEPETISLGTHYYEPYVICVTANGNAVVIEKE